MIQNIKFSDFLEEYLEDEQVAADFLTHALEEEDFETFLLSLKDVVKFHSNFSKIAKKVNLSRNTVYKALSDKGNPEFKTILLVLQAIGIDLKFVKSRHHTSRKNTQETQK